MDQAELEKRAGQGDVAAQLALGRHFEKLENSKMARRWFARAANTGSVDAIRFLAINLLTQDPVDGPAGVNMIRAAAHAGDAEAANVCANLAAQDVNLQDRWNIALETLEHAAARGWLPARAQLEMLKTVPGGSGIAPSANEYVAVDILDSPRVSIVEKCAAPEICDWLIERAKPLMAPAQVYDYATGGGRFEQSRSNSSIAFNIAQTDMIFMLMRERIAAIAGLPVMGLERTAVLHYAVGQRFEPHFDFLDPAVEAYARDIAWLGQRVATFLLYLNDDYEGGETDFPLLGIRHKGRKGDALLFWNVLPSGEPDQRTLHAGMAPTKGEKWVLSQWLRRPRS